MDEKVQKLPAIPRIWDQGNILRVKNKSFLIFYNFLSGDKFSQIRLYAKLSMDD